ncbi:MAG: nicotinamide-nucleotide amidohydrolase family protein, partial [Acidothermus sp.]|nr:nicotinamide-nucleotide amidohydrolase family protein [Acidothermus sp.]
SGTVILSRVLRTVGVWESEVADALAPLDAELARSGNPTLAYLASEGQTRVRITAKAPSRSEAEAMIQQVEQRARQLLGDAVFGVDDDALEAVVHRLLRDAGATVASAESLTGGLLAAALTATPGASETYLGGVIAYASAVKIEELGVPADLIARRGAVDPEVAVAMATGIRKRLGATYGLATTGVAGPTEQDGKPVGSVFVGLVGPSDPVVRELHLHGDRDRIRRQTVLVALDLLRRHLSGLPPIWQRPKG